MTSSGRRHSSPAVVRRRRVGLIVAALLALLLGVAFGVLGDGGSDGPRAAETGSGGGADAPAPSALEQARADVARMSLQRQVGQLQIVSFSGTSAPGYVLAALREGRVA